jgi:hypothetical protein
MSIQIFYVSKTFKILMARFRQPGGHDRITTVLDPWLCAPVFQQVCGLSVRSSFDKVQIKTGLTFARPAKEIHDVIFGGLAILIVFPQL